MSVEKIMKVEVLEIVELLKEDGFELKNVDGVYGLVKRCFGDN